MKCLPGGFTLDILYDRTRASTLVPRCSICLQERRGGASVEPRRAMESEAVMNAARCLNADVRGIQGGRQSR